MRNIGVILSGGQGVRAGNGLPKQYREINGKEVIGYVFDAFAKSELTEGMIIAAAPEYIDGLKNRYACEYVTGGRERNETVGNVLKYIKREHPDCEKVLFHDSARPLLTGKYIDSCFACLDRYEGVITASHITDSLGKVGEGPIDRKDYYTIQTPEAFRFELLHGCFQRESEYTAIVQQLPQTAGIYRNFDFKNNIKVTYPEDFQYLSYILKNEEGKVQ